MKTVLILIDSLNRHFLRTYGNDWVNTPNIDRLAERSVIFDNHWIGSAPCMPARRDIMTGRLNFLEREWGGLEPFDIPLPRLLREHGVYCHLETDHYHYLHVGGENYHTPFNSWNLHRGQEFDTYAGRIAVPEEPEHLGTWNVQYAKNRITFRGEADFPTPRTFAGAVDWLEINRDQDDFLLWVEAFDPHEPFDCPEEYLEMYGDDWAGPLYYWSGYDEVDGKSEAIQHLRRRYAATLTMTDRWLGRLLDEMERQGILRESLVILTTDHGHMLGEHDVTGKNQWHFWNEIAHIPLIVHIPGDANAGERRGQLTQNVDIKPTVMEYLGIGLSHGIHGESWKGILEDNQPVQREVAIYGTFGQSVNLTDGEHTYFRAPAGEENQPLFRYFLTPSGFDFHDHRDQEFYADAELGRFLPYTDFPLIRARVDKPRSRYYEDDRLYSLVADYHQTTNLIGGDPEGRYREMLVKAMGRADSPPEQYQRLGLSPA